MSAPSIEIAWGGGRDWRPSHIQAVRPTVVQARDCVVNGLVRHGFESDVPKRMNICQATKRFLKDESGVAHDARDFDVNVHFLDVWRARIAAKLLVITDVAFHEAIHTLRNEYSQDEGMLETAAAEGLAYEAGSTFCRAVMPSGKFDDVGACVAALPASLKDQLSEAFLEDAAQDCAEPDQDLYDLWFERRLDRVGLPPGVIVGVDAVQRLSDISHLRPAQLVDAPAEFIIQGA